MQRVAALILVGIATTAVALSGASATPAGACERDGLQTRLQTTFEPGRGYAVTSVLVTGIDSRCGGHLLSVALTGPDGAMVAEAGPVTVPSGGGSLTVPVRPVRVTGVATVHALVD